MYEPNRARCFIRIDRRPIDRCRNFLRRDGRKWRNAPAAFAPRLPTYFRSKARRAWIRQLLRACMRSKISVIERSGWAEISMDSCGVPLSTRFRSPRKTFFFARGPRPESVRRISSSFFRLHFASFTEPDQTRRFISARLIKFGTSPRLRYLLLVRTYVFDRWHYRWIWSKIEIRNLERDVFFPLYEKSHISKKFI